MTCCRVVAKKYLEEIRIAKQAFHKKRLASCFNEKILIHPYFRLHWRCYLVLILHFNILIMGCSIDFSFLTYNCYVPICKCYNILLHIRLHEVTHLFIEPANKMQGSARIYFSQCVSTLTFCCRQSSCVLFSRTLCESFALNCDCYE